MDRNKITATPQNNSRSNADNTSRQNMDSTAASRAAEGLLPDNQMSLQALANESPMVQQFRTLQQNADASPKVRQLKAVQAMTDSDARRQPVQLMKLNEFVEEKKVIKEKALAFRTFLLRNGFKAKDLNGDIQNIDALYEEFSKSKAAELSPVQDFIAKTAPKLGQLSEAELLDHLSHFHHMLDLPDNQMEVNLVYVKQFLSDINAALEAAAAIDISDSVSGEKPLGKGKIGEVSSLDINGREAAFKPDAVNYAGWAVGAANAGIRVEDARSSRRSAAVSRIDRLIGTNAVGPIDRVRLKGKSGSLADIAKGQNVATHRAEDSPEALYANPEIRKGLMNLQLLDAITGEIDRHSENIYIDRATGKVTGIDNDLSFGRKMTAEDRHTQFSKGLPKYIDYDVAMKVMEVKPEHMILALRDLLPPSEIDAAIMRLESIQAYIRALLQQETVGGWENTDISDLDDTNSYLT